MSEQRPSLRGDGVCERCSSKNVKSGARIDGKEGLRGSNRIPIDSTTSVELDNFVCLDCGYVESYISNRGILNRIEKYWQKVHTGNPD